MRWREQFSLRWRDVDLKRRQITLVDTKSGKEQYVPVNSAARAPFAQLRAPHPKSELVCPYFSYYTLFRREFWNPVIERAKVADFHWHDLRHTHASRLAMAGVSIYTVSKLLRHGDVKTSERYAHLSDVHLADASERLVDGSVTVGVQPTARREYLQ